MSEKQRILANMNYLGQDSFKKRNLINAVSMFMLIVISFFILELIFEIEFVCPCRPQVEINLALCILVPPVILTWVVHITEPFHQARIFSLFESISGNKIVLFFVELVINYISLSGLWIAAVLLDGNWYTCLMTNRDLSQIGIPCKEHLTYEESQIKAGYQTDSLDWGLGLIGFLIIGWSFIEILTAFCIRKKTWKSGSRSDTLLPPHYRKLYERLLEEQVSVHLKEELTKLAEARAKAICRLHLRTIGDHEQPPNNGGDGGNRVNNTVLEAWKKMSDWNFPFSSNESPALEEGEAEHRPSEEMDSGSTSSDRHLMT